MSEWVSEWVGEGGESAPDTCAKKIRFAAGEQTGGAPHKTVGGRLVMERGFGRVENCQTSRDSTSAAAAREAARAGKQASASAIGGRDS